MKTKYYNKRKLYIGVIACMFLGCLVGACDSLDEEPSATNQESYTDDYIMPAGVHMNDQERTIIEAKNKEYKDYLKSLNNN